MFKLNELYFGDLEAFDEAELHPDFFSKTFITPESMSTAQLRNNNKFIVVGRKGSGKTAVQMRLASQLEEKGYLTQFFRFFEDLNPDDYNQIAKSQTHITFASVANDKNLFFNYDFRPAWERIFLHKLAMTFKAAGIENKFTKFCAPEKSTLINLFEGISRSLTVKLKGEMMGIAAEVGVDLGEFENGRELPLSTHNAIARSLVLQECDQLKAYFFIDELVFSKLDSKEDEIKSRAAMVRDILRIARDLNHDFAKREADIHFICSLRPEIKHLISSFDGEIGKIVDGKDVELSWLVGDADEQSILDKVLRSKFENSFSKPISYTTFFCDSFSFSSKPITVSEFLRTNTWGRPRDVVRLLQSIQKASPNSTAIDEAEIKAGLDIYSSASAKEIVDELGVTYGPQIGAALKAGVKKRTYKDRDEFWQCISGKLSGVSKDAVIDELFQIGVIVGYTDGPPRYFAAHRGETYLKGHHKIRIHPALWNAFSIRSEH